MEILIDDSRINLSDTVFEFLDDGEGGESSDRNSRRSSGDDDFGDSDDEGSSSGSEENKLFWQSQREQLQGALSRTSSTEMKILKWTEDLVEKKSSDGVVVVCSCTNRPARECRNCSLRYIADRLREVGCNSAICKSKWRKSPDFPSGEHSYVDVVVESRSGKRSPMRVVIELNFRAEFEMARGGEEYNSLVSLLPEIFVGKSEKLKTVVKIVCAAAKKCMKDNKMHMAPWRKHKYMQSKWLGTPERMAGQWTFPALAAVAAAASEKTQSRPRASMLTFDLHCTAVEVI